MYPPCVRQAMPFPKSASYLELLVHITSGNMRRVRAALEAGASVDGYEEGNERPLMAAANAGKVEIMKLLVESGADLDASISVAVVGVHGEMLLPSGSTALHTAVYGNRVEALRFLIEAGANPNAADERGMTPLMGVNGVNVAEELIEAGADPGLADSGGEIPLHFAAKYSNLDIIDRLLSKAPSTINCASIDGVTPMSMAALKGQEKAVSHLLSLGASDKATLIDNDMSALFLAAQEATPGCVVS